MQFSVPQLCFGFSRKFIQFVIGCCGRAGFVTAALFPDLESHIPRLLFVDHDPRPKPCTIHPTARSSSSPTPFWRLHIDHDTLQWPRYKSFWPLAPDWCFCTLSNSFRVNAAQFIACCPCDRVIRRLVSSCFANFDLDAYADYRQPAALLQLALSRHRCH